MSGGGICPRCGRAYHRGAARCPVCKYRLRPQGPSGIFIVAVLGLVLVATGLVWALVSPESEEAAPVASPPSEASPQPAPLPKPAESADPTKAAIQRAAPSVVQVRVRLSKGGALGSGFVCGTGGMVLTNEHVIAGGREFQVIDARGRQFAARVIAQDARIDLALLQVSELSDIPALKITSAEHLTQGDRVIALGSPEGLNNSVSDGIVSALHRTIRDSTSTLENMIQTTAPISHGSSGGPLVEVATGAVVGVTTASSSSGQNLGFAIPGDTVLQALQRWGR